MSTFGQGDRPRFYTLDNQGELMEISGSFSDLKPLTAMISDPDMDSNYTPWDGNWTSTVTYDIGAELVLYRMMSRFVRTMNAQLKRLDHNSELAAHRMKVFVREFQKDPRRSAMFTEYRRKTKNRRKK